MPIAADMLADFDKYKVELKLDLVKSKTKIADFRMYHACPFDAGGKHDLLLVGKTKPDVLKAAKKKAGAVKAAGSCRYVDGKIRLKVTDGALKLDKVGKLFREAGIKFDVEEVAEFEGGAEAAQVELETKAHKTRLGRMQERFIAIRDDVEDQDALRKVENALQLIDNRINKGLENQQQSSSVGEILDKAERLLIPLERDVQIKWKSEGKEDRPTGDAKADDPVPERVIGKLETSSNEDIQKTIAVLETLMQGRKEAMDWQAREMETVEEGKKEVARIDAIINKLNTAISTAEQKLELGETELERLRTVHGQATGSNAKKRLLKQVQKQEKAVKALGKAVTQAQSTKDNKIDALNEGREAAHRLANKHGTGRHGAQTGSEQQARRIATKGVTPDQDDNEWGTSRGTDDTGVPEDITWKVFDKTLKIEIDNSGDKPKVKNQRDVLVTLKQEIEKRVQPASASSAFHSPELEMEAVNRILDKLKTVEWDEVYEGGAWKPLTRIMCYVGPPSRSKGWGHGLGKANGFTKTKLEDANKILNDYRDGKIDHTQMLKKLDVEFQTMVNPEDDTDIKGVEMITTARVMVDRVGGKWINSSQYPSKGETPGWSIAGQKVRKASDGGDGETAPQLAGV